MADYTNIETAMAIICDLCEDLYLDDFCPEKPNLGNNLGKCGRRKYLEEDAADVVPVVRCKDCKYWQDNNDGYPHEECRWGHGETPDANDFCSYGTRKDGDAADGLASVAETRFVYCPNCGARMDGGSYAKAD